MEIKRKYASLISFIKIFNVYDNANNLIEINDEEFELLKDFALDLNVNLNVNDNGLTENDINENQYIGMEIAKKYLQFLKFLKMFNNYYTADELVDIDDISFETLRNFALELIINLNIKEYNSNTDKIELYNLVASNVDNLRIEVVNTMPENPNENTLYIVR